MPRDGGSLALPASNTHRFVRVCAQPGERSLGSSPGPAPAFPAEQEDGPMGHRSGCSQRGAAHWSSRVPCLGRGAMHERARSKGSRIAPPPNN